MWQQQLALGLWQQHMLLLHPQPMMLPCPLTYTTANQKCGLGYGSDEQVRGCRSSASGWGSSKGWGIGRGADCRDAGVEGTDKW